VVYTYSLQGTIKFFLKRAVRDSGVASVNGIHTNIRWTVLPEALPLSLGFPEPITGDSGNGAHLLYRIDLANDEPATLRVQGCLAAFDAIFSNDRVSVDTANFNAGRIWKLYGTVSRKGDDTPDRPHRRSRIIAAPNVPEITAPDQLQDLAGRLPNEV
jgi:hypothetical protein